MKKAILLLLGLGLLFINCEKNDDDGPIKPDPDAGVEVQDFMWKAMNQWYLWQADVTDLSDSKFTNTTDYTNYLAKYTDPEKFYKTLLFKDDRFSFLNKDYKKLEHSFAGISKSNGLEFGIIRPNNYSNLFGYIRYIVNDSYATDKDIKRGDIFTGVNGQTLNINNYKDLLFSDSDTYTLNMATITKNNSIIIPNGKKVTLTKQEGLVENPIFIDKIFDINGKKIGYLMYNSFIPDFDEELNATFGKFKSAGVTDLVLDMRYNPGGSVNTSRLLASMIYGTNTNELYIRQHWNAKKQAKFSKHLEDFFAATTRDGTAINTLNLRKVYIIATSSSASASELIINGLAPYLEVVHIGETTAGKNEFSIVLVDIPDNNYIYDSSKESQINADNKWGIQPLVGVNENADGFSAYTDGLVPDIPLMEDIPNLGVLGNSKEPLLAKAIEKITQNSAKRDFTVAMPAKIFSSSKMFTPVKDNMYLDKPLDLTTK